jgi:hypothetical protein
MALPSNVVGLMGIDNSGNVVTIPADAFTTSQTTVTQAAAVMSVPASRAATTNIITNATTETVKLTIDADENYLVKVNSTRDNFDNSILYESNRRIGLNTKSPQFAFDVNQNSINVSNLKSNFGYKLNGRNFAFTIGDSTSSLYGDIFLGDAVLQTIVVPYLNISKTAITPTPAIIYKRPLYVDDTGLVDAYAAFTEGSIIFSSQTQLTQNNAKLFWNNTTFKLNAPVMGFSTGVTAENTWTFSLNANVPLLPTTTTHITSKKYTDDNDISSVTVTGTTTKTITITKKDLSTITTTFTDEVGVSGITGSGTTNYMTKFTGATSIGNSQIYDTGSQIGIKTSSPFYGIDIELNTSRRFGFFLGSILGADDAPSYIAHNGTGITGTIPMGFSSSTYAWFIGTGEAMRLNSSLNLLVGTSSGVSGGGRLQVNGNVNITGSFQVNGVTIGGGGGTGTITGGGTAYNIPLYNTATNIIDSNIRENFGRIGINTAPPSSGTNYLTIGGGVNVVGSGAGFFVNGVAIGGGSGGLSGGGTTNYIAKWSGGTSLTNSNITDDGSTIGMSGTVSISGSLFVNGVNITGSGGGGSNFWSGSSSYPYTATGIGVGIGTNGASLEGYRLRIEGSVGASGGFFESSDIRLKNVLSVNLIVDLSSLNVIKYTLKSDSKNAIHYGYSAQQVQDICPDFVNAEGEYLSLNYTNIHTIKIAQLEEEVRLLKAKLGM